MRLSPIVLLSLCALPLSLPATSIPALAQQTQTAPTDDPLAPAVAALDKGDVKAAAKGFEDAWNAGNADAGFYLGRFYELGLGTAKNPARATEFYRAAAEKGSAEAQNRLGLMYLDGRGVVRDYKEGARLVCAAADQGDANGAFNCGVVYMNGRGMAKDEAKAVAEWTKAADQGHIAARNLLGLALKNGTGIKADPAKAVALFQKTADQGNALGLYEMALAYQSGTGITEDLGEAYVYANLAAARNHPDAAKLRDQLEEKLSAEDLAKAQEEARTKMDALRAGTAAKANP
ncbi:tetratricopeptide repeat protein [Thioclava sp. FTW29]|uniref:Tetratricopeptide repeat protein n=1 Tax=Thioclava litoralis TaxID=3076557 RepID=A0ABZ1E6D0_9RHOB|nr:tetratricopeptide repeat protein [Thioclava sp. FTW29]